MELNGGARWRRGLRKLEIAEPRRQASSQLVARRRRALRKWQRPIDGVEIHSSKRDSVAPLGSMASRLRGRVKSCAGARGSYETQGWIVRSRHLRVARTRHIHKRLRITPGEPLADVLRKIRGLHGLPEFWPGFLFDVVMRNRHIRVDRLPICITPWEPPADVFCEVLRLHGLPKLWPRFLVDLLLPTAAVGLDLQLIVREFFPHLG
mmetsp:Transcript_96030/g.277311  ORF Transcript_96030/g.277311 Transcript_96030/m.277311 type:complete len:207 (+) Transcript_96030:350-970(+)